MFFNNKAKQGQTNIGMLQVIKNAERTSIVMKKRLRGNGNGREHLKITNVIQRDNSNEFNVSREGSTSW